MQKNTWKGHGGGEMKAYKCNICGFESTNKVCNECDDLITKIKYAELVLVYLSNLLLKRKRQ